MGASGLAGARVDEHDLALLSLERGNEQLRQKIRHAGVEPHHLVEVGDRRGGHGPQSGAARGVDEDVDLPDLGGEAGQGVVVLQIEHADLRAALRSPGDLLEAGPIAGQSGGRAGPRPGSGRRSRGRSRSMLR